jgi:hypothetical protein
LTSAWPRAKLYASHGQCPLQAIGNTHWIPWAMPYAEYAGNDAFGADRLVKKSSDPSPFFHEMFLSPHNFLLIVVFFLSPSLFSFFCIAMFSSFWATVPKGVKPSHLITFGC